MKELTITVAQDGSVKLETKGFRGNSCRIETSEIERALGVVTSDKPTAEASAQNDSVRVANQS